jgi:hypothetical protein
MKRASPEAWRDAIFMADALTKNGILFVAVPVLDDADREALLAEANSRLDRMVLDAEEEEAAKWQ